MEKINFKLNGIVMDISEKISIKRESTFNINKKIITIMTPDKQLLFPEIRNKKLRDFTKSKISKGDSVQILFIFQGSQKNGKLYNNICINEIKKI